MFKNLKKRNEGFTIIEVLIVLAIAGLIMLIVFLAVPALQRNSRNTAIKNDVANVLGGVAEFQSANDGRMPTAITGAAGTVTYTGTNPTTSRTQGSTTVAAGAGNPAVPGTINVVIGQKCTAGASNRAVAARFLLETATGTVPQCQDS